MLDPIMPSFINKTGYTIIAEPIIVFAKLMIVCAEVSVPTSKELFSTFTLEAFSSYGIYLAYLTYWICASILAV